jgi:hypothetical protein
MTAGLILMAVGGFALGAVAGWAAHGLRRTLKDGDA